MRLTSFKTYSNITKSSEKFNQRELTECKKESEFRKLCLVLICCGGQPVER